MTNAAADVAVLKSMITGYRDVHLFPKLLRLLAEGEPVDRARLAAEADVDGAELDEMLAGLPTDQWDDQARLVGLGITTIPTPHRFIVDGRELYTWCALDALMFPAVLGRSAHVVSACPATGELIIVTVHPDRLGEFSPAGAVASRALPRTAVHDIRTAGCALGNFFATVDAAADWHREHPEGTVLPLPEEFARGLEFVTALGWRA